MVVPMEQWASQPFQDKSADLWVVMLSDQNEKYSDRMERSYKAFAVTFELRFPFPLYTVIYTHISPAVMDWLNAGYIAHKTRGKNNTKTDDFRAIISTV